MDGWIDRWIIFSVDKAYEGGNSAKAWTALDIVVKYLCEENDGNV